MKQAVAIAGILVCTLAARPSAAEARRFVLDPARSSLTIRTGRAGLFSFAGHEHVIVASGVRGEVLADAASLTSSSVSVMIAAPSLKVQAEGEPAEDVEKVQARMAGPELLDVARFSEIAFHSQGVSGKPAAGGAFDLAVSGTLSLHGVTQSHTFQVHVEISGPTLTATGRSTIRQSTFGLEPVSVGGVVKVKDDVVVDYKFVGMTTP